MDIPHHIAGTVAHALFQSVLICFVAADLNPATIDLSSGRTAIRPLYNNEKGIDQQHPQLHFGALIAA